MCDHAIRPPLTDREKLARIVVLADDRDRFAAKADQYRGEAEELRVADRLRSIELDALRAELEILRGGDGANEVIARQQGQAVREFAEGLRVAADTVCGELRMYAGAYPSLVADFAIGLLDRLEVQAVKVAALVDRFTPTPDHKEAVDD